ncbi:MAG TPA: N-acetyltransferase [Thermoleophilia bacterium]|nr:N-acetyltransferase [Thermoleophilia bacterium]
MQVRQARVADVPEIQRLVNGYASQGVMLPRSLHSIYGQLRDHQVMVEGDRILGCVALSIVWEDLAEIRSLAVVADAQGGGIGRALAEKMIAEAQEIGIRRVFVLTFVEDFFVNMGFHRVEKSELPHKIWRECVHCVHFPDCDEVALVLELDRG